MKTVGIYKIENIENKKVYIGQSNDIKHRFGNHRSDLRNDRHANPHLQSSWNKHGEDCFTFSILEECSIEDLTAREQHYANLYARDRLYNVGEYISSPRLGTPHTINTKEKLSSKVKDLWLDPKYKTMMMSRPKHSEETRRKIGEANKRRSIESRQAHAEKLKVPRYALICTICSSTFMAAIKHKEVCSHTCKLASRRNKRNSKLTPTPVYEGKLSYKNYNPSLPTLYFLAGQSGSGKTWIAKQLSNKFTVLSHDNNTWDDLFKQYQLPILYESPVRISTFINKNKDKFNIKFIVVKEDIGVVESRILSRGGKGLRSLEARHKRIDTIISHYYPDFIGTSQEVLTKFRTTTVLLKLLASPL